MEKFLPASLITPVSWSSSTPRTRTENGKMKEKVKESNRTNESNKSKNSKNPNGQKNSKGNLPKTSYASGIVGYGVSVLASVLGAFAIGKKRKED